MHGKQVTKFPLTAHVAFAKVNFVSVKYKRTYLYHLNLVGATDVGVKQGWRLVLAKWMASLDDDYTVMINGGNALPLMTAPHYQLVIQGSNFMLHFWKCLENPFLQF